MDSEFSDLEIVREVLAGDRNAYEKIVKKYEQKVFRLCHSIVGAEDAEDAAQEIFLKTFESLSQFKAESSFSTWLYRIAANHCLNLLTKRKRKKEESLDSLIQEWADKKTPFSQSLEDQDTVQTLLNLISPNEKVLLILREIEELSYAEIAETLEISLESVKVGLFRARESLLDAAKRLNL
ncbi:MAG: RNA polymerase sigma factor [Elusimicrobia bacterium]|nr:RNA polymerase sigma factor [Elusimicrobiota bacterium]